MSHPDTETLAKAVVEELDPGQIIDNKVVLSRRQLVAIAGSGLGAGALAAIGADEASAQAAGQVGTSSEPVNVEGYNVNIQNLLNPPVYSDDSNAPNESVYYDSSDQAIEYKDSGGSIQRLAGLQDGEDFDGQGTSNFTNLASVETENITTTEANDGILKTLINVPTQDNSALQSYQHTADVSTSGKDIFNAGSETAANLLGHFVLVTGSEVGVSSNTFVDLVLYTFDGGETVVASSKTGSVGTRTYAVNDNGDLNLTMSGDTWDIAAVGISERY